MQTQAPAVPAQVVLPADLGGKNAQLADDELRKLGIVNISYAFQDAEDKVGLPLANWIVTRVEPAPGAVVSTTDTVRAAGAAPLTRGAPGYPAELDGDKTELPVTTSTVAATEWAWGPGGGVLMLLSALFT